MKYNPQIHHRRSIRLKGYDYSQAGAYFVTICCQNRKHRFGKIENDEMVFSEFGQIAYVEWAKLPERFPNFELDVFQIMPNHMHGIIVLTNDKNRVRVNRAPTAGDVVGAYKSLVANICLEIYKSNFVGARFTPAQIPLMGKLWQRNYHEHIIRDNAEYQRIARYIINNPANWKDDKFY